MAKLNLIQTGLNTLSRTVVHKIGEIPFCVIDNLKHDINFTPSTETNDKSRQLIVTEHNRKNAIYLDV